MSEESKKKRVPRLHEVLAVEADLEGTAKKVIGEARTTFSKKHDHFLGHHKSLRMFDENRKHEEAGAEEHKELVTTVPDKLKHVQKHCTRWFDALLQKERTNQEARADLIVEGKTIVEDVPAVWLLGMESRLKMLREMYDDIPTRTPGVSWVADSERGKGVFKSEHLDTKDKAEKTINHKVVVPATDHHPAQVERWSDNVKVGVFESEKWTSMISPAEKSEYLDRIDKLIRACKKARQRANQAEVVNLRVAKKLFDYIDG